jgi:hypothetical protein
MIIIVSGLPRSGTSLMMQMLQAGGMPLLTNDLRPPDADNPNGYWEYEPVKRLPQDNSWLPKAEGKAVKVVSALLQYLPPQHTYKIIFMQRPMQEVLASQRIMLERRGAQNGKADDQTLGAVFAQHLDHIEHWLAAQQHMTVLYVNYQETIADPAETATRVAQFLDLPRAVDAMARAVDPRLHRQRGV